MRTADDGVRTRDLRFTKPLLYRLSYVGAKRTKHCIQPRLTQVPYCRRFTAGQTAAVPGGCAKGRNNSQSISKAMRSR